MAISIGLTQIRRVVATGRIYLRFADGAELEFPTAADARAWAQDIDLDNPLIRDILRKLIMRWWMYRDPTGATPALVEGKAITLDMSTAAPLVVG